MPSRIGIINHRRRHVNDEKKRRRLLARQPPSLGMPTLDQLLGSSGAAFSSPPTNPDGAPNTQAVFNEAADAAFDLLDDDEHHDNIDPDCAYFRNTKIPNPDAASPSLEYEHKFRDLLRDFNAEKWPIFEELMDVFVAFSQSHVGLSADKPSVRRNKVQCRRSSKNHPTSLSS